MTNEERFIPVLRKDIRLEPIIYEEGNYILFEDPMVPDAEPTAVNPEMYMFVNSAGGTMTFAELRTFLSSEGAPQDSIDSVVEFIEYLEAKGYMENDVYYERLAQYNAITEREMICADSSYPQEPEAFKKFMNDLINLADNKPNYIPKALIAPHIDLRLGELSQKIYANAYNSIKDVDADLFVIFGTSHNINSNFFMLTERDYKTPLGAITTDKELIAELTATASKYFRIDSVAHDLEHSVEYQAVMLKYLFENKNVKVLPILVGSIHDFMDERVQPTENEQFAGFIKALNEAIAKLGRKPFFIAGVDFGHIGRKFADEFDAEPVLPELKQADMSLIDSIKKLDGREFFNKITAVEDKWKVCGFSPIYALLHTLSSDGATEAELLDYAQWNEIETRSAVSFAAISVK